MFKGAQWAPCFCLLAGSGLLVARSVEAAIVRLLILFSVQYLVAVVRPYLWKRGVLPNGLRLLGCWVSLPDTKSHDPGYALYLRSVELQGSRSRIRLTHGGLLHAVEAVRLRLAGSTSTTLAHFGPACGPHVLLGGRHFLDGPEAQVIDGVDLGGAIVPPAIFGTPEDLEISASALGVTLN